jgi:Tfp pilus assembly protein PilE
MFMENEGFSLVKVIIILAIVILLAVIALPYLTTSDKANALTARESLRKLSIAAENYAAAHSGAYPASVDELSGFIASAGSYCANASGAITVSGEYSYACALGSGGYTFSAAPVAGSGGKVTCTVTTGGVFNPAF